LQSILTIFSVFDNLNIDRMLIRIIILAIRKKSEPRKNEVKHEKERVNEETDCFGCGEYFFARLAINQHLLDAPVVEFF